MPQKRLISLVRNYYPAFISSTFLVIVIVQLYANTVERNDGFLVYGTDDAFIHMAMSKNLVQHGVWGVTQHAFTSSSSSPLWTLAIAVAYLFLGVNVFVPLIYNVLIAIALLFFINYVLRRINIPALYVLAVLQGVIWLPPLDTLIFIGMEHLLHGFLSIVFVFYAAILLSQDDLPGLYDRRTRILWTLAVLLSLSRYEGLFLVAGFCLFLVLRRRTLHAVALGVAAAMPLILFGLLSVANGWPFLPSSVAIKSDSSRTALESITTIRAAIDYVLGVQQILLDQPLFLIIALLCSLLAFVNYMSANRTMWNIRVIAPAILLLTVLLQLRISPTESSYLRYKTYLVLMALVIIPVGVSAYLPRKIRLKELPAYLLALPALLLTLTFFHDRYEHIVTVDNVDEGMHNIYLQQYQMGRFLHEYYEGEAVVLNDIGLPNYLADIRLIDIFGLGTLETANYAIDQAYSMENFDRLIEEKNAKVAIFYDLWVTQRVGAIPENWHVLGYWSTPTPTILGGPTVWIAAIGEDQVEILTQRLQEFRLSLPSEITQQGPYMDELGEGT